MLVMNSQHEFLFTVILYSKLYHMLHSYLISFFSILSNSAILECFSKKEKKEKEKEEAILGLSLPIFVLST